MSRTRKLFVILMLALNAASVSAQQTTPPAPGPARPLNLPKVTERKLGNGLTVVLAPMPNVPKITAILSIRAGSPAARDRYPGIAQIAAAVADEGTESRSSQQIKEELRSIGGSLTMVADTDATTVFTSSLSEFPAKLFDLVADVVRNPSFPEKEVALAKENTIQAIRSQRADPNFLASERLQKAAFGSHPYSFVVPDEKSIAALTRENLREFVAAYYVPNNSHLVVAGDFKVESIMPEIEKAFGAWASRAAPDEPPAAVPVRDKRQIYFVNRPGSVQSTIYMGNVTIPRKHEDYFRLRTADTIFGGSFYSRLTRNIREEKGYTYSPFSFSNTQARLGIWTTGASVRNEVTGLTLLEMFYEMDKMRVAPVSAEELESAKTYSKGNFSIELASQAGVASRINTIYTFGLQRDFIETFRRNIDALTLADIQRAAAKYFDSYRMAVVIVGDWEKVKDQVTPFGEVTMYDADGNVIKQ